MRNKINSNNKYPPSIPPVAVPVFCAIEKKIEPSTLMPLLNTYIYVWLKNGNSFWMFPVKLADNLLCGYIYAEEKWEAICISCSLIKGYY